MRTNIGVLLLKSLKKLDGGIKQCKGLIFRCTVNTFVNAKGEYIHQERMIPMKRLSCPGCENCGFIRDNFREYTEENLVGVDKIEHGRLYRLRIIEGPPNWKTGVPDDFEMEFLMLTQVEMG